MILQIYVNLNNELKKLQIITYSQSSVKSIWLTEIMKRNDTYQTVNTFTRSPSLAQICSYIVIALETVLFYVMIRPNIKSQTASIILTVLFSVSLFVLLITTFICSYVDPSDTVMTQYKLGKKSEIKVNIQDLLYCDYCMTYVTTGAKHCRQCDRCVQNFDHHCMWINNCVGSKNYTPFIVMITSTCFNLGTYISAVIFISVQKFWSAFMGFIITCWVVLAIVFVLWFLLFNLNLLHFYLMCKGYTTYQFIVARKQEERRQQLQRLQIQKKKRHQKMRSIVNKNQNKMLEMQNVQSKKGSEAALNLQKSVSISRKTPDKRSSKRINTHGSNQDTNSNIKIKAHDNEINNKAQDTTNVKVKDKRVQTQQQNMENNAGNIFSDQSHPDKNSEVQSIKLQDQNSIKGDQIYPVEQFLENKKNTQNQLIQSQSENESVRISQFFIRNKSFNYILSSDAAERPHKKLNNSVMVEKEQIDFPKESKVKPKDNKIKSKSASIQNLNTRKSEPPKKTRH